MYIAILLLLQGTWKETLKQKFRNGRRPLKRTLPESGDSGAEENVPPLPATSQAQCSNKKKRKQGMNARARCLTYSFFLGIADNNQHDIIDERYTQQLEELADEHHKEVPSRSQVKKLMKVTFGGRRSWILKDTPTVAEVIQVFPSLKLPSAVS